MMARVIVENVAMPPPLLERENSAVSSAVSVVSSVSSVSVASDDKMSGKNDIGPSNNSNSNSTSEANNPNGKSHDQPNNKPKHDIQSSDQPNNQQNNQQNIQQNIRSSVKSSTYSTQHTQNTTNFNQKRVNTANRKFITEALRHPEELLGCASTSLLEHYLFSERLGVLGLDNRCRQSESDVVGGNEGGISKPLLLDNFSQKPLVMHGETTNNLSRLALEVRQAIDTDPMYGPRQDKERHNVGIEYELLLEQTLRSMDIPFETEAELRVRGTARTPDILLSCPVGIKVRKRGRYSYNNANNMTNNSGNGGMVNSINSNGNVEQSRSIGVNSVDEDDGFEWKIVSWIDSKALFGDVDTHTNSVLPQVETYVHRFGPGLVIYWFGHAPLSRLGDGHGDVVVVGGGVPEFLMLPTGELCGQGGSVC